MVANRFVKAIAAVFLFNSILFLCVREETLASEREEEAKKYTEQLRKSKDAKTKITAIIELGKLGQIKQAFIADALPDIYKATEDKDPGVRAAAAEALGKADEPYDKAGVLLVKMLKEDKEDAVKIGAIRGLTAMRAKEAVPAIREVVKANADNKKSKLGAAAKEALKALGGKNK